MLFSLSSLLFIAVSTSSSAPAHPAPHVAQTPCLSPSQLDCFCKEQEPGDAQFETSIDLSELTACNASSAGPFGMRMSPDGKFLYVALVGGLFTENCLLAKIDTATNAVVSTISVGLFPEEIVFTTTKTGAMKYGFISNSTDSTITVIDAHDQVVATIPVPCYGGNCAAGFTAYPFGLAVSPTQTRVYVGTLDGSGMIYSINTTTLAVMPNETLNVASAHGRMAFYGRDLIVTATEYEPDFSGSTAEVVFVDPAHPAEATTVVLASSNDFTFYPSTQDVAVNCNGIAFVSGFDIYGKVFVFNANSRSLVHTLVTPLTSAQQGNAISKKGLLAVGDFFPGNPKIALLNAWDYQPVGVLDLNDVPGFHAGVNEVLFNSAGTKLYATVQYSSEIFVFNIQ